MSPFVESLTRLYRANKITKEKLEKMLQENKISKEEFDYICNN